MREIAPGLHILNGRPRWTFNVYLMGDVLVDASTRYARRRILKQVAGKPPTAMALTHGHADHQGSAHKLCTALGIPLMCGELERNAIESGDVISLVPPSWTSKVSAKLWSGPGHPVERGLRDGSEVAGFRAIETPGHSPGHISFFRERDGVLVAGDTLFNLNPFTGRRGLQLPPDLFTLDPELNRASVRKLAELGPSFICFGHGRPVENKEFMAFLKEAGV